MTVVDKNDLAYWFPPIKAAGLLVPRTEIIRADGIDFEQLMDGKTPTDFWPFIGDLMFAAADIGCPCFLRTGHGSGKHQWAETCYLEAPTSNLVMRHVSALVEWSHTVHVLGLPTDTWAVRELIPTTPLFRCARYGGMPFVPEWRVFVRDNVVEHIQPYWPMEAIEEGRPDDANWRALVETSCSREPFPRLMAGLRDAAGKAVIAVGGGYWSVDFLWSAPWRQWWLTDMAEGDRSFRYEP